MGYARINSLNLVVKFGVWCSSRGNYKFEEYCISSNKCWAPNKHQLLISAAPLTLTLEWASTSNKRLTLIRIPPQNVVLTRSLTITNLNCTWNKKTYKKMKVASSTRIFKTIHPNNSLYCYLEREYYKVLKLHVNNSSYFEMSISLF